MAILNDLLVNGISRFVGPITADEVRGLGANYYGVCNTAAATAAKVVTCEGFVLKAGVRISVRFTNGSTSSGTMTLNVNGTGAKNCGVYLYNNIWQTYANRCEKNEVLEFMYDGTYWITLTPYTLRNYGNFSSRLTSANISQYNGGLHYILATSSMTTGKTPIDSHILNMNWDYGDTFAAQLAVGVASSAVTTPGRIFSRGQLGTSATWSNWLEVPRLSGALTNGQIIVSDESTGTALLKGVSILPTTSIQATATEIGTIATGDYFLFSDQSDNGKVKASLNFDTTKTTEFLRRDGTWAAPGGGGGGSSDGPFYVAGTNSIACVTSSPYYSARWKGTNSSITSLYTGLTINFKIDVAGNGSYGTVLNINNLGEHPVCANVNTYVSTRYAVGCIISLVYDADQTATAFINSSSSSTITGVWKIADYDSTNTYTFVQVNTVLVVSANAGTVYRNQILLSKPDLSVIPVNNVKNGPGTYNKTLTSQSFDPFGPIYYFNYTGDGSYNPGNTMSTWCAYRVILGDIRYSFNINSGGTAGTTALTAYRPVYIKALYDDSTKQATLAPITSSTNYLELSSLTQSLPSTNPNSSLSAGQRYIYIYLGHAYDKYRVDFAMQHQVYTWDSASGAMQEFTGAPIEGSGTFTVTDNTGSSDTWSYYKIGKQVTVSGKYTGSSSALSLQGLPFTVKFKQVFFLPVQITSPSIQLYSCQVTLTANATTIGTYGYGSNATSSWLSFAKSAGTQMTFSYITDD